MDALAQIIIVILQVMTFAIFARMLLSWFPQNPNNGLVVALFRVTEPILEPFRRIIPRFGMFDLSPMVAIIVLQVVAGVLSRAG